MFSRISNFSNLVTEILEPKEKIQLGFIFFLMILGAGLEVIGISLIIPFIQIVTQPEIINQNERLVQVRTLFHIVDQNQFIRFIGISLIAVFIFKNLYSALYNFYLNHFLALKRIKLTKKVMTSYMEMPYVFHLDRQTPDILRNINAASTLADRVLLPFLQVVTEFVIVLTIVGFLVTVEPLVTLAAVVIIGGMTGLSYLLMRSKVSQWALLQHKNVSAITKWLLQGFGGIKETKILGIESYFINKYRGHYEDYSFIQRNSTTLNQLPRLFLETLIVCGIILFIVLASSFGNSGALILSKLSLFAFAAIRLLPSLNKIMMSSIAFKEGKIVSDQLRNSLKEIHSINEKQLKIKSNSAPLLFEKDIEFSDVVHFYKKSAAAAVDHVSFKIKKGQSFGIVGQSGAGKSTLVDLMIGLMNPTSGNIVIDGVDLALNPSSWQEKISYIPQQIFLVDDTLRRNIAFGVDDSLIDDKQIWLALERAQLKDFIKTLPEGLDIRVGELGIRFSGGQRQRIGIARALYRNSEVLIMDEATSALDKETELEFSSSVEALKGLKTVVVITHRMTLVKSCDQVLIMKDGKVIDRGSYQELLAKNADFAKIAEN